MRTCGAPYLVAGIALVCAACEDAPGLATDGPVVYTRDIQPVFSSSCATSGCHDAATRAEGLSLASWEDAMRGAEHGAVIIPYRAKKSHLVQHMNQDSTLAPVAAPTMPPSGAVARQTLALIMRWVDEGAADDDGTVAFATAPEGRIFVANQAEDQIAVIDRRSNLLTRLVPVGVLDDATTPPESPHNVTVDPQGEYYYVNLIVASEVWKLKVSDNTLAGRLHLPAGSSPAQVVISSDGATGYVSNLDLTGSIRAIRSFSTASMTVTKTYEDSRIWASHGVQLTHSGRYLWSCNQVSDNLAVIDLVADTIAFVKADPGVPDVPTSPTPLFGPYQLVFTPDDAFAFVTCRVSNEVRVFETSTLSLVATIPVGPVPLILAMTPDGSKVFVANRGNGAQPTNGVSVISTESRTVIATISGIQHEPHGVVVTPDGLFAYVTTENIDDPEAPHHPLAGGKTPSMVYVVDAETFEVVQAIEVGAFGAGIAVTP